MNKYKFSNDWENWIGCEVIKHSKKPFKSGKKVGCIINMIVNPYSGKMGFKMDDDSIVDCYQVKLYDKYEK